MQPKKRPLKTLERVLSKAGIGSRVEARSWIHAGRVTVNGKLIRNPDHWIDMERDRVRFDDKPLEARERLYVLLYKPTGYLTTYKDPEGRPTVYDLIADVGTFLSPVGRLDLDTSGLLLMTNDNRFAERVTNPTVARAEDVSGQGVHAVDRCAAAAVARRDRAVRRSDAAGAGEARARLGEVHALRDRVDRRSKPAGPAHGRSRSARAC